MSDGMTDQEITRIAAAEMGKTAWPTIGLALGSIATYFGFFAAAIMGFLPLWLCFLIVSYMVYVVYTPLHEAVHNNIAGDHPGLKRINDLVGHIVGSILGIPFAVHHPAHMAHHRSTNIEGKDPDLVFKDGGFWNVVSGGPRIIANEYSYYFQNVYPKASLTSRAVVWGEIGVALGWRVLLALSGYPLEALVLGILSSVLGTSLLGMIFAWIVHIPFDQTERYRNTATIFLPKWLHNIGSLAWLWQNYHSIHHLFPRVPFYRYRFVHDQIYQGMKERSAPTLGTPVLPGATAT